MQNTIVLNNFAGGLNGYAADTLQPNEAAALQNWIHMEGSLQSFTGKTKFNSTAIPTASVSPAGLFSYIPATGTPKLLAASDAWVYTSVDTSGDMRPLWYHNASDSRVSFTQWGAYVYMAAQTGGVKRWDGFEYHTGTVTIDAGTLNRLDGTGTQWVTGAVLQGDTVFINSTGTTWIGPYYVTTVTDADTLTLTTNASAVSNKNYIIVRVHGCGITAPAAALTVLPEVGSGLNVGIYKYSFTYRNSVTGFESALSPSVTAATTTSANSQMDIDLPAGSVNPSDLQINQIRVYRTRVNGSIYKLQQTITRNATTYQFANPADDTTADGSLGAESPSGHDTPNTSIQNVRTYNSRLYGWGADNILRFSDLDASEYWPTNDFSSVDPFSINQTAGGYITVGRVGQVIRDIVPESGAYSDSGTTGGNLLILKSRGLAYRWFGWDWSDFQLQEAFPTECLSVGCATRYADSLFWITRDGPVLYRAGASLPANIYQKPFPIYSKPFAAEINGDNTAVGVAWRDWYFFSYLDATTALQRGYMYHIPTQTWTTIDDASSGLGVKGTWATVESATMTGLYIIDSSGFIWKLFSKTSTNTYWTGTTGVATIYESPAITLGYELRRIKEVRFFWSTPSASQTVTAEVWTERSTSARSSASMSVATGTTRQTWTRICPNIEGRTIQIRFTGTFTVPMMLRRIEIELVSKGKTPGT